MPLPTQYQPLLLNLKRVSGRFYTEPSCHCLALLMHVTWAASPAACHWLCYVPLAAPELFSSCDSMHCPARIPISSGCAGAVAGGFNMGASPQNIAPLVILTLGFICHTLCEAGPAYLFLRNMQWWNAGTGWNGNASSILPDRVHVCVRHMVALWTYLLMIFKGFNFKSERGAIAIICGAAANTLVLDW